MTDPPQPSPGEETPSEAELDYVAPRLDELRRAVEGRTILYTWLLLAFIVLYEKALRERQARERRT